MPPSNGTYEPLPTPPDARSNTSRSPKRLTQKQRLKRYQHDVELAQRVMEPLHKQWRRHIEFYKGNQWLLPQGGDATPRDGIVINMVASVINTVLPAITTQPPKLRAVPMREQDTEAAPFVEALLNFDWERLHVNDELTLASEDMLITGNGWLKVGYEYEAEEVDRDPDDIELELQRHMAQQAAALAGELPTGQGASLTDADMQDPTVAPQVGGMGAEGAIPPEGEAPGDQEALEAEGLAAEELQLSEEEDAIQAEEAGAQLQAEGIAQPEDEMAQPQPVILSEDELRALIPTKETFVVSDDIFVERVSPFEVYVDPEARSLDEARWIAQRVIRPLEDVRDDPRYKNTKRLKATEESRVAKTQGRTSPLPSDVLGDYTKRVVVWEYYNIKERTLCVFADGNESFLFEGSYSYPFNESPFVMLRDYIVPDELWAYGEVTMIEGPQVELNKIRTQQLVHNKRFNRKFLYKREALDPEGVAAIQSDQDGVFVPIAHGQNIADSIQPIPDNATAMPTDRYQMSNVVEQDITILSGVSDYQRGAFLPRHVTASEANLMSAAQDLRARDKLDRIEKAAAQVGYRMKALAQEFYDSERQMLISGNGIDVPVTFDKTDLQGDFDVKVDASSTQPTNELFAQQQAERMYQLMRPDPMVKPEELIKEVLRAYGIKAVDRFILSPEEQMMQQIQAMTGDASQNGQQPSATGTQPGQAEGNIEGGADLQAAIAGGQEAAGV